MTSDPRGYIRQSNEHRCLGLISINLNPVIPREPDENSVSVPFKYGCWQRGYPRDDRLLYSNSDEFIKTVNCLVLWLYNQNLEQYVGEYSFRMGGEFNTCSIELKLEIPTRAFRDPEKPTLIGDDESMSTIANKIQDSLLSDDHIKSLFLKPARSMEQSFAHVTYKTASDLYLLPKPKEIISYVKLGPGCYAEVDGSPATADASAPTEPQDSAEPA